MTYDPGDELEYMVRVLTTPALRGGHGLPLAAVADLTDRQIHDVYFGETDEEGKPKRRLPESVPDPLPEAPPTAENYVRALKSMVGTLGITEESIRETWRKKFGEVPFPEV